MKALVPWLQDVPFRKARGIPRAEEEAVFRRQEDQKDELSKHYLLQQFPVP